MSVTVTEKAAYKNFGRVVHITNGVIEADVSIDVGPRILNFSLTGGRNIMMNDLSREISEKGPKFDETYVQGAEWYIYGGHRLWTSPEHYPGSYFPDNEPVQYTVTENGAIFTQVPQTVNGCQFVIELIMDPACAKMQVNHTVKNIGGQAITCAPWSLSVLDRGGVEIIPQNTSDTGFLANRVMSVWPYTNMNDPRVFWGDKYITLRQDPAATRAFKIGLNLEKALAMYVLDDTVFIKKYPHIADGCYPDFGVSFETYTCGLFLEMESLGELKTLQPGDQSVHTEHWQLDKKKGELDERSEASVDAFVKRYLD